MLYTVRLKFSWQMPGYFLPVKLLCVKENHLLTEDATIQQQQQQNERQRQEHYLP